MIFSLDAFPVNNNILENNDYNGQMIFAALSDPLFKFDGTSIIANACKEYITSKNGKEHTFVLRDNLYFSDGKKVTAQDYQKSINHLLLSNSPLSLLLANISTLSSDGLQLKVLLKRPDFQFYKILSRSNFTPCRNKITSGRFEIKSYKKDEICLRPNIFHREFTKNQSDIKFARITDPETELNLYNKRTIDFTSNTSFRHNNVQKYRKSLCKYPSFITMSLSFINKDLLQPKYKKLRRIILYSINRTEIAKSFNNIFTPTSSYVLRGNNIDLFIPTNSYFPIDIRVGYDDFYPNKKVLEIIKKQLAKHGINIVLVKDNFYKPNYNYDMKLSLYFPDFLDDSAFYRSTYFNALVYFANKHNLYFKSLQKQLYKQKISTSVFKRLNRLLLKNALIIPLFSMNSIYLSRNLDFSFQKLNYESL